MDATGRGRATIRGQVAFEEAASGRMAVVITELPYQVNKTSLIEKMADLVGAKRINDVSDIRDESDRTGMRIVVEVKRDGSPHTVMQQLFKHTQLQTSFSANMLALVDGQPLTLGLKRMLEHYITYRAHELSRNSTIAPRRLHRTLRSIEPSSSSSTRSFADEGVGARCSGLDVWQGELAMPLCQTWSGAGRSSRYRHRSARDRLDDGLNALRPADSRAGTRSGCRTRSRTSQEKKKKNPLNCDTQTASAVSSLTSNKVVELI